jgi:hypothetical protein
MQNSVTWLNTSVSGKDAYGRVITNPWDSTRNIKQIPDGETGVL